MLTPRSTFSVRYWPLSLVKKKKNLSIDLTLVLGREPRNVNNHAVFTNPNEIAHLHNKGSNIPRALIIDVYDHCPLLQSDST